MPTFYIDPVAGNDTNDGGGWYKLAVASGTGAAPVAGEVITGAGGATAKVIKVTGTWATTATLYLYNRNATAFANGEVITCAGGGACVNAQGSPYDAIVAAYKTIAGNAGAYAAGDILNVAETAETAAAGTVTPTLGSTSIATTNDLTAVCPAYTTIRIGTDLTVYSVKSISAAAITLNRPYRGAGGAGQTLYYHASLTQQASNCWNKNLTGTLANPIVIVGGVSKVTNAQNGYSIIYGGGNGYMSNGAWVRVNLSRILPNYFSYPWTATMTDCNLTDCETFRSGSFSSSGKWIRTNTINQFVVEGGPFSTDLIGCNIAGLETANPSGAGFSMLALIDTVVTGWRNSAVAGQASFYASNPAYAFSFNARFIDPILDELGVGNASQIYIGNGAVCDIVFQNPTMGVGTYFGQSASYGWTGRISLSNINGSATDHRAYFGYGAGSNYDTGKYYMQWPDAAVYHTAAPSSKISLYQSGFPHVVRHFIPCTGGVAKTVSVWLRKNSNPASTVTLNAGGSGYAVNDLLAITQGGAGGSRIRVATIGGGGAVATISIDAGGWGYTVANALDTTNLRGSGSGCKLNITAVGTGYGSASVGTIVLPTMRVRWLTGSAPNVVSNVAEVPMADVNDSFQQASQAVTPSIDGVIIIELVFQSSNAGALAWYDDIGVA